MESFLASETFTWFVFPVIIFLARIADVSLGTIRIIMISKSRKELAMFIGFIEITIWLLICARVIQQVDNIVYILAYSSGFAAGSYVGILLDEKMALGKISVRLILHKEPKEFINKLMEKGFGVTWFEAKGSKGKAWVVYSIMHRRKFMDFDHLALEYHPKAFISVEDSKIVKEGIFHPFERRSGITRMLPLRKIK